MLKRIALLTGNVSMAQQAANMAARAGVQIVAVDTPSAPPVASVLIAGDGADVTSVLEGGLAAAGWYGEVLGLAADALDCRESFLPGSTRRVCEHAGRFAAAMGMDDDGTFLLERAAMVRDIGKVLIPNEVLLKRGLLNYEEWELIHKHSALGADLIAQTASLRDTVEAVAMHHENWDGTGYPSGAEGEAIPLPARAMRILDVYCAMTSPRQYRKGHATHEEALAHLRAEQGKHFDPALVDIFIRREVGRPWESVPAA